MLSRKFCLALLLGAACCQPFRAARAEYLFSSYLAPSFTTQYSAWDVFYTPYGSPNYPDYRAPYGTYQTASAAGFTPPANANPSNPSAYWDARNATIIQTATDSAFIIGPGVAGSGNIYSFATATAYQLVNSSAAGFGNVVFQFQSDGTLVDFDSIRLQYTGAGGNTVMLAPNESIREYRASGSSFGGLTNRNALQWNLGGLGVTSYQILFSALGSSNSFQQAVLDTSTNYGAVVPAARTWTLPGAGNWNTSANWQQGSTSVENGNVRFANSGTAVVTLDASHTVGEIQFNTPANVTISPPGGFTLTANTGITTAASSTGLYTLIGSYAFGAFNVLDVAAGEVRLSGTVSGPYGFTKNGAGTLTFSGNNTFTGGVGVGEGTLRLAGTNAYTGATNVANGTLVVGTEGALGTATTNVAVGADSSLFGSSSTLSAALLLDGNRTLNRNVAFAPGNNEKRLAATNAGTAATFAGTVAFGTSDNVKLTATAATDRLVFSGAMSGGATSANVTVDGAGTVVFSGAGKTYGNATTVRGGTLQLAGGTSFSGGGAINVANGATLRVDGTLTATGQVTVGGTYQGAGTSTFNGGLVVNAGGLVNAVGNTLTVNGVVTNNGTIRLSAGAVLAAGGASSFVNNGVIDLLDGSAQFPANFTNGGNGVVLTPNSVRLNSLSRTTSGMILMINSLPGFSYQLQRSGALGSRTSYVNVGAAQAGGSGTTLTFTDPAPPAAQAFYRVVLSR